jgi:2-hydroxy-6-oxonona-2,4-dienedioate hydrolase
LILQYPADVAGLTLRVLESGSGDDNVVLLHGVGARADRWRENLGPLSDAGLHLFALDLPGHGFSTSDPAIDYSAPGFADVVGQFVVDRLGGGPVVLIGTSLGGHVAARLTLAHPELVSAAVLVGPTGMRPLGPERRAAVATGIVDASLEGTRAKLTWLVHDSALVTDEWVLEEHRINSSRGTHAAIERLAAYFRYRIDDDALDPAELERLASTVPLLFVWGADDTIVPPSEADVLRRHMTDVRILTVPEAGHAPYFEVPAAFNETVEAFIRDVRGERREPVA